MFQMKYLGHLLSKIFQNLQKSGNIYMTRISFNVFNLYTLLQFIGTIIDNRI